MKNSILLLLWMTVLLACNNVADKKEAPAEAAFDEAAEKTSIMKTIEAETSSFYKRDYEGWKKNFVQAEYAFQAWNNSDGSVDAKVGWEAVDKKIGSYIKDNPVAAGSSSHPDVKRKNMIVKFFAPTVAYLVWDQYNSNGEMKTYMYSKEERIMEKQQNEWKIANVSAFWDYKKVIPVDSLP